MNIITLNAYFFMLLSLGLFSAQANALPSCEKPPFQKNAGQEIIEGYGNTYGASLENAHTNLQLRTGAVHVKSQYIQHQNGNTSSNKSTFESNSQVLSDGRSDQGIIQQKTIKCNKQYISYILYDNRSLFIKISKLLAGKNVKIQGESYLVNGPILSKFSQQQATNTITAALTTDNQGNYLLTLGEHNIAIDKSQLFNVISFPSLFITEQNHNVTSESSKFIHNTLLNASAFDLINHQQITVELQANKNQSTRLYMCTQEGLCNILQGEVKGSKHFTLLSTRAPKNITPSSNYLFAINTALLNPKQLTTATETLPDNLFLTLIALVETHPNQTDWINIKSARNF